MSNSTISTPQPPAGLLTPTAVGEQLGLPVYSEQGAKDPVAVCQHALQHAKEIGAQIIILDTAGRLHIDQELMSELQQIDSKRSGLG